MKNLTKNVRVAQYQILISALQMYRLLCHKQIEFLLSQGMERDSIYNLSDDTDKDTIAFITDNCGYFISGKNLFSSWLDLKLDFDISNVMDSIHAFNRYYKVGRVDEDVISALSLLVLPRAGNALEANKYTEVLSAERVTRTFQSYVDCQRSKRSCEP